MTVTAKPRSNAVVRATMWLDKNQLLLSTRVAIFAGAGIVTLIGLLVIIGGIANDALARGVFWVIAPVALLLIGSLLTRGAIISICAAAIIVFALYILGTLDSRLSDFAAAAPSSGSGSGLKPEDVAFLTTLGTQILILVVVLCVVVVALRGDPWVFVPMVILGVGVSAVALSAVSSLHPKDAPRPKVADLIVTASYIGPDVADGQQVSVVFLVPKLDAYGHAYDLEQRTHLATADGASSCAARPAEPCTIHVHVIRGANDADVATWLADAAAAKRTNIFALGPSPSPM